MVVISATALKEALFTQATFPVASVTKTVLFAPEAIFVVVTAASASFGVVTTPFASLAVIIPKSLTLNGLVVVPVPSTVVKSATAPKAPLSNQATFPVASVTKTVLFEPDAIFVVVTAASASFVVVTAPFANLAVIIPKSLTLNGLVVVPVPSMVVKSATAPNAPLSNQATFPVASVTKTVLFAPDAIFVVVTAASASFGVVTAPLANLAVIIPKSLTLNGLVVVPVPSMVVKSATAPNAPLSNQATFPVASVTKTVLFAPDAILIGVTAPLKIFAEVMALFEIIGAVAVVPKPPKSPAN